MNDVPQSQATPSLYESVLERFPKGVYSAHFVPVTINGLAMELRIFTEARRHAIEFGLFLSSRRYARKTLVVHRAGRMFFDDEGSIPEFDRHDADLSFNPTLEEVVTAIQAAVTDGKQTRGAY